MLSDLKNEAVFGTLNFESVENGWELTFKLDINDGTNDLRNLAVRDSSRERLL